MTNARSVALSFRPRLFALGVVTALTVAIIAAAPANAAPQQADALPTAASTGLTAASSAAAHCNPGQSGAAVATTSSGRDAVRTTIGVAKSMDVPVKGQIVAVMVMFQESSIRNLANDGSSQQSASWSSPGRAYWLNVTRLSLKYPHDRFGSRDGAHDTDSIGLYQQRPSSGWGNYGNSTGTTDPEGVVQRLLDPRWEAMAFFGGGSSAAPTSGLLDIAGWQDMPPTYAANAVQQSNYPEYYAQWEGPATSYVNDNQDAAAIGLPWYPGGGGGALACTSIPSDPAAGEAGRNPFGYLDTAYISGNTIRVAGWAMDPDAINGITAIHFYDQGPFGTTGYPTGLATENRDDVNRAYNVIGHFGFSQNLPWTGPGTHTICAYGINVGRGTGNPQLGCKTVQVPGPIGWVDAATRTASGQIEVNGWAADPATPGPEEVHIYVTGPNRTQRIPGTFTGDARPDVTSVYPWAGGSAGFHAVVPDSGVGDNMVCVYAINVNPPNTNPGIGCQNVSTRLAPPVGYVDLVAGSGRSATVVGWTVDPNAPNDAIPVHLYVTGPTGQVAGFPYLANDPRPDVDAALAIGGKHGFSRQVTLFPGSNTICAYGIGNTSGNNALLIPGCSVVQAGAAQGTAAGSPEQAAAAAASPDVNRSAAVNPATTPVTTPVTTSAPSNSVNADRPDPGTGTPSTLPEASSSSVAPAQSDAATSSAATSASSPR